MPVDSAGIDSAIIGRLVTDATLMALLPGGVFFGVAKPGATRFVAVSLVDELDEGVFGGRAIEDALYFIEAVVEDTGSAIAQQAAARIETLLEDAALTVPGYTWMTMHRERRSRLVDVDEVDGSRRQRWGAYWRVQVSVIR